MSTPSPEHPIYEPPSFLDQVQGVLTAMLKVAAIAALLMYSFLSNRECGPPVIDNTLPTAPPTVDNTLPTPPPVVDNTLPEEETPEAARRNKHIDSSTSNDPINLY